MHCIVWQAEIRKLIEGPALWSLLKLASFLLCFYFWFFFPNNVFIAPGKVTMLSDKRESSFSFSLQGPFCKSWNPKGVFATWKAWSVTRFISQLISDWPHTANLVFGYISLEKFPEVAHSYHGYTHNWCIKSTWKWPTTSLAGHLHIANAVTCEYNAL